MNLPDIDFLVRMGAVKRGGSPRERLGKIPAKPASSYRNEWSKRRKLRPPGIGRPTKYRELTGLNKVSHTEYVRQWRALRLNRNCNQFRVDVN